MDELHQLGADDVVPEEFETSIEIFALVLRTYKLPQDFVMQKAEQVRREGYALLRRSELPELAHHLRGGTLTDAEVETCRIDDDSPAQGKTLAEISLRPRTGASVIAWTRWCDTSESVGEDSLNGRRYCGVTRFARPDSAGDGAFSADRYEMSR